MEAYRGVAGDPSAPLRKRAHHGRVYVVGFANYAKIGFTTGRVQERLQKLSTGCPELLHVLHSFPGVARDEKCLHRRFEKYKLRGEWFQLEGELLTWLQEQIGAN